MDLKEKDLKEKDLFLSVLNHFAAIYPYRKIELKHRMVYIDGKEAFNTDGYNLLYNLTHLCETLEKELL